MHLPGHDFALDMHARALTLLEAAVVDRKSRVRARGRHHLCLAGQLLPGQAIFAREPACHDRNVPGQDPHHFADSKLCVLVHLFGHLGFLQGKRCLCRQGRQGGWTPAAHLYIHTLLLPGVFQ